MAITDPTAGVRTILVPVDGSPASMDAIAFACSVAKRNKGKVYAVHVIEVKRSLPLDADLTEEASSGEDVLVRAEKVAQAADFKIEGELLQAREAGHAIVDEAMERGVAVPPIRMFFSRSISNGRFLSPRMDSPPMHLTPSSG